MASKFKTTWNSVDETCPHCNSITKKAKGLTKQNIKSMFSKPSLQDCVVFLLLCSVLIIGWAYQTEINHYNAIAENPELICSTYYDNVFGESIPSGNNKLNMSGYLNTEDGN